MPWFDLPLEQLRQYRTETEEPPELDNWWQLRLAQARTQTREPGLTRYEADIYAPVEVYDAEFSGAGGDRIRAWYLRPAEADERTPVVVKFIGYGGGRGLPAEHARCPPSVTPSSSWTPAARAAGGPRAIPATTQEGSQAARRMPRS